MYASWQRRSSWHQQLKDLLRGAVLLCSSVPRPLVDPESDIYKHTVAADTRDSVYRVFRMMTFPWEQFLKNTGCSMRQRQNKQAPSTIEQYNTDIRYVQGSDVVVRKYRVCYSYEIFTNMLPQCWCVSASWDLIPDPWILEERKTSPLVTGVSATLINMQK